MIIHTSDLISAIAVTCHFIERGARFHVKTLEIFQTGPTIETGDDMWETTLDLMRSRPDINITPHMGAKETTHSLLEAAANLLDASDRRNAARVVRDAIPHVPNVPVTGTP